MNNHRKLDKHLSDIEKHYEEVRKARQDFRDYAKEEVQAYIDNLWFDIQFDFVPIDKQDYDEIIKEVLKQFIEKG